MRTLTKELCYALTPSTALDVLRRRNERFDNNIKANRNLLPIPNRRRRFGSRMSRCASGRWAASDGAGALVARTGWRGRSARHVAAAVNASRPLSTNTARQQPVRQLKAPGGDGATDESGPLARRLIGEAGREVVDFALLPNEVANSRAHVARLIARHDVDVVILSGGTGLGA